MADERYTHVRVSIRPTTSGRSGGWNTEGHTHSAYHELEALYPISGQALNSDGARFGADWEAVSNREVTIKDGWRLATLDAAGADDMVFEVVKVLPRGRKLHLMLKESGEIQPTDQ